MAWMDGFNDALDYIEAHLTEEIDPQALARLACCSAYHFQRMFTYLAGVPLKEYIRRRRLSLAAVELQGGAKVLDTALQYGYQSPTAFSRAFEGLHGVAPSRVKGEAVRAYPPLRLTLTVTGAEPLRYRLEELPGFRALGIGEELPQEVARQFEAVPRLWQRAAAEGVIPRLMPLMDGRPQGLLGLSFCGPEGASCRYCIGVATTQSAPEWMAWPVPPATWAVFPGEGAGPEVAALEKRIVLEWLPGSGYEYAQGPDMEVYLLGKQFEVWIPVRARER